MKKFTLIILSVFFVSTLYCQNFTTSGVRIPHIYFVTTGVGQSDDGVPPAYYETFSYDKALLDAGIADFNIMEYTSVLPADAVEIPMEDAKKEFVHGAVLESIMAKALGCKGDILVAGVGRIWAEDQNGNYVGGYAAEYTRTYPAEYNLQYGEPTEDYVKAEAKQQLTKSLKGELTRRGYKVYNKKPMTFAIDQIKVTKNYGVALSVLGFVSFKYAEPIVVNKKK